MKFLDKETGTLGERIRTLFKEQSTTIISILMALGMTLGVLIEALLIHTRTFNFQIFKNLLISVQKCSPVLKRDKSRKIIFNGTRGKDTKSKAGGK